LTEAEKRYIITVLYNAVIIVEVEKMSNSIEKNTLEAIHAAAKKEFLEKGFQAASLRNIVKNANVTTGAFYGYYKSKEELFDALAGKYANHVLEMFNQSVKEFENFSEEEQAEDVFEHSANSMDEIIEYAFSNRDAFKMVLECSEGTKHINFIHKLVVEEVDSTCDYIKRLKKWGYKVQTIDRNLIHMIASGLFSGIFETIIHDIPKEKAIKYILQLEKFYSAGWSGLLNIH